MKYNDINLEDLSDDQLIVLFKQGNGNAFITLYERHKYCIIAYAYKMLNDKNLAEDILQETFLYVFRLIPRYTPKSKFRVLLYKTARNLSITKLRRMKGIKFTQIEDDIILHPNGLNKSEDEAELRKNVEEAVNDLPLIYKEVILLKTEKELTNEDISKITGIPVGTVKSRIHNAIELLRKKLRYYLSEFLL